MYSGHEDLQRKGVAVWLHRDIAKSLISYEPINSRVITVTLQAAPVNITIIQVYAPTTTDSEDEHDRFYEDVQRAINRVPRRTALFVMGDFNAKIGECPNQLPIVGQYGLGERNEAGYTLYSFCNNNNNNNIYDYLLNAV